MIKTYFIYLLSLSTALYAQSTLPDCAVLDLEGVGVDSVTSRTLSEKVRTEVFQSGAVRLVERNRMDEILSEQGFQQTGCASSECRVETGRLLGVSQLIVGTVSMLASSHTWSISLSLLDVETGAVLQMKQWTGNEGVEQVLQVGIPVVTHELLQPAPVPQAPVTALQTPAQATPVTAPPPMEESSENFMPLGFAFLYPIQIPFSHTPVYGLSINVLYGQHYRIYGLAAGLASQVEERMYGAQVGFYNSSLGQMWGMQAGVINQAKEVRGVQVGLVNDCEVLQGVQIGLINRVRSRTTLNGWVPIINVGF